MKPGFALDLSHTGIGLFHRGRSAWHEVGAVSLESADLAGALAMLHKTAAALAKAGVSTKLMLPASQVLYTTVAAPGPSEDERKTQIRSALKGMTPYYVDDLVFDFQADGDRAHIAVVARETLQEAEAFAAEHRFNPVSFAAHAPQSAAFMGEAFFGETDHAADFLNGETVEPDRTAMVISDRAEQPENGAAEMPGMAEMPDADIPGEAESDPTPAFCTRRTDGGTPAPAALASEAGANLSRRESRLNPVAVTADPDEVSPAASLDSKPIRAAETISAGVSDRKIVPLPSPARSGLSAPAPGISATSIEGSTRSVKPVLEKTLAEQQQMTLFGARKSTPPNRKRLGVILTLVLLLILVLIAIWSSLLLPDTVARFFSAKEPRQIVLEGADQPGMVPTPVEEAAADEAIEVAALSLEADSVADLLASEGANVQSLLDEMAQPEETPAIPLTPEAAETAYVETGVWQLPPVQAAVPPETESFSVYIASIDQAIGLRDAIALPEVGSLTSDHQPSAIPAPPPPGTRFILDERGFVRATPDGALTPEGALVFAGRPPVEPVARPKKTAAPPRPSLRVRPLPRPADLKEISERLRFGGLTRAELSRLRPAPRPVSDQALAEAEAAANGIDADRASELAMLASDMPLKRPEDFRRIVEKTRSLQASSPARTFPQTIPNNGPVLPTRASVARQATVPNGIRLGKISLVGVYGSPSQRRALVRLPSGRFVKVSVGDRIDGGRVAAISGDALNYRKGGRSLTLKMPKS